MKCINCGSEVRANAKFCSKCGAKVEKEESKSTAKLSEETKTVVIEHDKNNTCALVGFIMSLVSICCCCGSFSVVALVLSIIGLVQVNNGTDKGKGLAIAGIVISAIGVVLLIIASAMGELSELIDKANNLSIMFR